MNNRRIIISLVVIAGIIPIILWGSFLRQTPFPQADGTIRHIPLLDQTMVVVTAFVVKPLYMIISIALAWLLRRSRSCELKALRWGLLAFFIGEAFCSVNYLFFQDKSIFSEFLHNYGMVVSFSFIGFAMFEGLDRYVVQYSHPNKRCSFITLCTECIKSQDVPCRVRQVFIFISLVLCILVFIPILAEIQETSYYTYIYGTLYNYIRLKPHLLFELRYCPLLALVMFIAAFIDLLISKEKQITDLAKVSFSAGIGALGFGIFRLFFNSIFARNLAWAASWEEITEFILMAAIAYGLWLFRKSSGVFVG